MPAAREDSNKKARGALSCAECRRLKLKCDRSVPCSSCTKRGCASICPTGVLRSGPGTRLVLNDTQDLHRKIQQLSERIRTLEDALETLNLTHSTSPHPLLSTDLLLIKAEGVCQNDGSKESLNALPNNEALTDAVGTLTIGEDGVSQWYGGTAGVEFLLDDQETPGSPALLPDLPPELALLSGSFPFSARAAASLRKQIWSFLPAMDYSWDVCNYFFNNASWLYGSVIKERFLEDTFNPLYDPTHPHPTPLFDHHLALVYIIMAMGILLDLNRQPYHPEATKFLHLSKCALGLDGLMENATIPAIQTLHMMMLFEQLSNDPAGAARCWSISGLLVKLAQSIGLHRDSARWNLNPSDVQVRRTVWWEFVTTETWLSFACGRPPSVAHHHSDCDFPKDDRAGIDSTGNSVTSFARMKLIFTNDCVRAVADQAFSPKPPSYAKLLELDSKVRGFEIHGAVKNVLNINPSLQETMSGYIAMCVQDMVLLYLHRRAMVEAIREHPEDPLKSSMAPSVVAAYKASCSIMNALRLLQLQQPILTPRFFQAWIHSLSAVVVLGTLVIGSPRCSLSTPALLELNLACDLFAAASEGYRPAKALPTILKIRARAQAAMASQRPGGSAENSEYDFSGLSGLTRLKKRTSPSPASALQSQEPSPSPTGVQPEPRLEQPATYNIPPRQQHQTPSSQQYLQWQAMHRGEAQTTNGTPSVNDNVPIMGDAFMMAADLGWQDFLAQLGM